MSKFQVTKRMEFDAAHRLFGYDGPCSRVHGHRYVIEVTVEGECLDGLGMLVDFGMLQKGMKELCGMWDHRILLSEEDTISLEGDEVRLKSNPTAEVMASFIWRWMENWFGLLPSGVVLSNVRIYETPDCWVDYHE